ncbi:response regulator transcription factor [Nocardia terpenica]|uniref:DNA-binding response regulator n=1 Tax=Nocardia terpenica TaxID=455432 RepID=A0A164PWV4_9NOCA|nr:response regulator transcription factor [Nocardia terpenica]KZM76183.1 DNA-binding response regulator [Nocardia terpenica]MBF6060634.1 response regulator transcription factor [Nocardia terpenica]MBF6103894.1 response regulator transcription factor [Nocardia terpenica]MBF6111732.1 response regulator transcription factor [Nocardia terpenica]MBF6118115.1 response regulator transcription factor [Nocardia terpenica]
MRVLLVEDEPRLAETVRRGLEMEGFVVQVAATGPDGLWLATEDRFDVIVLDIMLPGMSGYEVLRRVRARDVRTPVLMLTAKDGDHEEADALDLGADDYLTKPFSFVVLFARLRALLRRRAPQQETILRVGDLVLDPVRREVRRGADEVSLTPREFGLLEFLMRRPGAVVTKTEILRNVWDAHYDGPENVVEVYVGYLRKKIDAPFGRASIKTHRGVGYQLLGE